MKPRTITTWTEVTGLLALQEVTRWMNLQVGLVKGTVGNPNASYIKTFKTYLGWDVKITDAGEAIWYGQLTHLADINRQQIQFIAREPSHELKRRRYTHNWILANGIASASPTGGTADRITDAHQGFTADSFNAKGLLVRPSAFETTDTILIRCWDDDQIGLEKVSDNSFSLTIVNSNDLMNRIGKITIGVDYLYHGVFRFPVNIPRNATISSALLRLTAAETDSNDVTTDIYLYNVNGDARSYSQTTSQTSAPTTNAVSEVAWTIGNITNGNTIDSSDIKTLVEAFIQDPEYHPGAYMGIFVKSDEADVTYKQFKGYPYPGNTASGSTTTCPKLIITWTSERSGKWYTIDDTTATEIICTGDDLEADSVIVDDVYYVGESDKVILDHIIGNTRSLTPSVKATTTFTALAFQGRWSWDVLMDYQLKLGFDLWVPLGEPPLYTLNFTDTHTASGLTLDYSNIGIFEEIKKLYNSDEYYSRVDVIGTSYSPVIIVTNIDDTNERWLECTGGFDPGALSGREVIILTNNAGGDSAIGRRYTIIGNTADRLILEKGSTIFSDGFCKDAGDSKDVAQNDQILIRDGAFLQYVKVHPDLYDLGKDFRIDDPGIFSGAEAETYADQVGSDLGGIIYPLVILMRKGRWIGLDVGKTLVLNFDEFSSATYVCTHVKYTESPNRLIESEYWLVKEL